MAYDTRLMSHEDFKQFHKVIASLQSAKRRKDKEEVRFYENWLNNYFKPKYWKGE